MAEDFSDDDEYAKMHREYQFLEQNRLENTRDSSKILTNQQEMIDQLKRDNEQLKRDCRAFLRKPRGSVAEDVLSRLSEQEYQCEKRIILEKKKIEEFDKQLDALRDRIRTIRANMGGVNFALESAATTKKQITILENRLDKSLIRFNEALSYNQKLREQIDTLRRERVVYDGIYRNMEKDLHAKEKKAAELIEKANQNYSKRDQARIDTSNIEHLNNEEHAEFERVIADYDREDEELAEEEEHKYDSKPREDFSPLPTDSFIYEDGPSKFSEKTKNPTIFEKVQSYDESFQKIKSATGIEDIDELVEVFIAHEDQNFSLFNYVSSQTNDIEKLEESIASMREEELKVNEAGGNDMTQHEQLRKDLKVKLEIIHSSSEKYEKKYQESSRILNSLKSTIQNIFTQIGCDRSSMSELLTGEQVSETNMMQYLGVIEQKANEILRVYSMKETVDGEPLREGPTVPKVSSDSRLRIQPPGMDEYVEIESDEEVDLEVPQDLDRIKEDVLKYLTVRPSPKKSDKTPNKKK